MAETQKLVRLMRKDLPGDVAVERSLQKIKGIGPSIAAAVCVKSGIPRTDKMGDLTSAQMENLTKVLENLGKQNLPLWMLNRRKDIVTGISTHLLEADLVYAQREDIQRMKRIRCYKGVRHMLGLKVRGQRTRSTGRKGAILGVMRKGKGAAPAQQPSAAGKAKPAPAAAPKAAKTEEAKK